MRKKLQRISVRSNTVPVKPLQLHYPPEGGRGKRVGGAGEDSESGRGRTDKEGVCENISVNEKQIADQEFRALLN